MAKPQTRSETALQSAVMRFGDDAFRICYMHTKSGKETLTLLSDVFMQYFLDTQTFKSEGEERLWVLRTTHKTCMDYYAQKIRKKLTDEQIAQRSKDMPFETPKELCDILRLHYTLLTAVALHYGAGDNTRIIGRVTGKSASAVQNQLEKVKKAANMSEDDLREWVETLETPDDLLHRVYYSVLNESKDPHFTANSRAKRLKRNVDRALDKKMIDRYIEIFYDGASLERIYEKGDRFDIIYLDIEMSGKNGIEAAKSIRRLDRDVLLIYVSSYETYFMQLFEVEPFRFIKKPIKETEFEEVIDFAYERIIEEDAYFEYKYNKTVGKVLIRKIMYFESAGRIVNIHTEESTYRYYGKLDEVERRLVQNKIPFLRIHKSFYVNFHFVDKITFSKLILSDGTVLQISQDRQNIIRKRYLDILGGTLNE